MNEGQINKVFHVFGSKSREIVNQFKMSNKSRFYFDYKLAGDRHCDFIIIDASEIKGGNITKWIEGMTLITRPIIFIVDAKQYFSVDSLLTFTLKLEAKFGTHCVSSLKSHRELVSVLEGVYELLNGFSTVCLDFADFACFLSKGQYYWSETVYS
ncbi:hypothetical protein [Alkalimarinus alittae]|uniref:Uncharacterized protein n=1 Tax=Alkalimarinus alittae TaxID=2961619 RepID=A0ABY6N522_9ALTE|nr:hypothetical protein [Alkalimarinus alittae]UZE97218.1 hypothetical protein NKI27_05570 [Alkalimarinus alittae]